MTPLARTYTPECVTLISCESTRRNHSSVRIPESLDIERRHMAALTWDAMFKSRRAAILADGGGLFDSVVVWRPA